MTGRATQLEAAARVAAVADRLAAGESSASLVSFMAAKWGVSRRQARRYVRLAESELRQDLGLSGPERGALFEQTACLLLATARLALHPADGGKPQPSAAVGAARELRQLLTWAQWNVADRPADLPPEPPPDDSASMPF